MKKGEHAIVSIHGTTSRAQGSPLMLYEVELVDFTKVHLFFPCINPLSFSSLEINIYKRSSVDFCNLCEKDLQVVMIYELYRINLSGRWKI